MTGQALPASASGAGFSHTARRSVSVIAPGVRVQIELVIIF
jgi:hypothetical protein